MDIKIVEPRYITCKNCIYSVPATFPEAQIKCSCKHPKVLFYDGIWICHTYKKRTTSKNGLIGELATLKCRMSICKDNDEGRTLQECINSTKNDITIIKVIEESLLVSYKRYLEYKKPKGI